VRRLFLYILLSTSTYVCGQEHQQRSENTVEFAALPDAPSATQQFVNGGTPAPLRSLGTAPPALLIQSLPPGKARRTADRSFVLLTLFQLAASIADVESTQHGLANGAAEGNPLFGSHPSRAFQYGVALPLSAGIAAWSYKLKRTAPQSRHWIIPQVIYGLIHCGATIRNLQMAGHK